MNERIASDETETKGVGSKHSFAVSLQQSVNFLRQKTCLPENSAQSAVI
jgi:hypothetical protein